MENEQIFPHTIYNNYGCIPQTGEIVNLKNGKKYKGHKSNTGYLLQSVSGKNTKKHMYVHRFIWECVNGIIPERMTIDHININKTDNRISNLRCVTQSENLYSYYNQLKIKIIKSKPRPIKVTNVETGEIKFYTSIYKTSKAFDINFTSIWYVLHGNYKYVYSSRGRLTFEYADHPDAVS